MTENKSLDIIVDITNFIPSKYNRNEINDNIIKYLTYIILATDLLIFFGSIKSTVFELNNIFSIVNFIFIIIFFIMNVAWLHYKLQHIIVGSYKLFMDLKNLRTNSKYYSGLEIPDIFLTNKSFPCVTIQLPVYKEDLENTLKPTILSAIEQANRYTKETGSICNIIVWGAMNTTISVLFAKRLEFNMYNFIKQQSREIFFTSSLYGSLSARFSIMYFTHLFNLNISFGATQKDDEKVRLIDWISSTKYEFILYSFYTIAIFIRLYFFPYVSLFVTSYYGCLPMALIIFWYWIGPLSYDILPIKKDKIINNINYIENDKMFTDIYKTQILNSPVFIKNVN